MTTKVLVLAGPNHGFAESAEVIGGFLTEEADLTVEVSDDKAILSSGALADFDVLVFGTGFTRTVRQANGAVKREPDLTPEQEDGLLQFVSRGKGLVGVHGTAWWIGGQAVDLIGGHANWHPPGLTFTVKIEDHRHPVMSGLDDFEVEDEIYISAYEPRLHVLASAEWHGRAHPMAWVKQYGQGRVFYSTLGHTSATFVRPAMQQMIKQGVRWCGAG
jgi:type 1 glutamine amidotransferase